MSKRMYLYLAFIILFLIAIQTTTALEKEEIYSDWTYSGEKVITNDKEFSVAFTGDPDKIIAITPSGLGVAVDLGACSQSDNYEFCFDDTQLGYHNYTLDKDYYQARRQPCKNFQ